MSFRFSAVHGSGLVSSAASVQPPSRGLTLAHAYGGRGRGGRGNDDASGLILGPGTGGVSPEFAEHLAKKKIIIPGGPSGPRPGAPAKLIVPEKQTGFAGILDASDTVTTPTAPGHYRPPAGFMNEELLPDETTSMDPSLMISRLRSRAGKWYTLAKFIPTLYKQNYDSSVIDEMTGITPLEQNKWVVAGTIHESLKLSGKIPEDVMDAFDGPGGEELLHPFRFLGTDMRIAAALYIVENRFTPTECETLARSMKEWERRPLERTGFSDHPGDCLAFKYLRDALEMRTRKELVQKAEQGLKVAVTDSARDRLRDILSEEGDASSSKMPTSNANMLLLRLTEDEIGFRTLPVLGDHERVRAQDFTSAPRSTQEGAFGVFTMSGTDPASLRWVALPQWKALSMARLPVALEVADCSKVSSILAGTKCKTDEDRKRLQGPGLLVFECTMVKSADLSPNTFYIASVESSLTTSLAPGLEKVELVSGSSLKSTNRNALATLLFVCRPPLREALQAAVASSETSQLLQI